MYIKLNKWVNECFLLDQISQAIKQKLSLKNHSRLDLAKKKLSVAGGPAGNIGGSSSQQEDDVEKAKLLFGDILLPSSKKK